MDLTVARRWVLPLVAALALVAGACDGDDGGASPNPLGGGNGQDNGDAGDGDAPGGLPEVDGCEIVTEADAEAILGGPVERDEGASAGLQTGGCIWTSTEEGNAGILTFQMYEGTVFYGEDQLKDQEGFEAVEGLGDRAFFIDIAGPSLQVLDGDIVISLSATVFEFGGDPDAVDDEAGKEQLRDLAEKVLDRL